MRLISSLALLMCMPAAFAHTGSEISGGLPGLLHFLFAPHHWPVLSLLVVAAIIIIRIANRAAND